ncbi:hypothetical protein LPJ61_001344 [Coemansia biformis]|uniref:Homeobox domain-containing protein n=1 Tax=Coemansia biformis TaxID=1286918 RepID=A0A9W7YA69_9FUNG|nr:hypothetical protein LPJ61_001344 [Coemansia biformis]
MPAPSMLVETPLFVDESPASLYVADSCPMFAAAAEEPPHGAGPTPRAEADAYADASPSTAAPVSQTPDAAGEAAALQDATSAPAGRPSAKPGHRKRARATSEQVSILEAVFVVNRSPASRMRDDLALRLGMAPRQVQVWFQNRRAKEKSQQRNPRSLQSHSSVLLDQLAYASVNPELYSMVMPPAFMPACNEPGPALSAASGGLIMGNPTAVGFGIAAAPQPPMGHPLLQDQQLFDSQMALAAAVHPGGPQYTNPWLNWNIDIARQAQGIPMLNLHIPSLASIGATPPTVDPAAQPGPAKPDLGFTAAAAAMAAAAAAAAGAPLYATNIPNSRRESEMSGITTVASPIGLGPMSSAPDLSAATTSSATSPATTPPTAVAAAAIAANPALAPGGPPPLPTVESVGRAPVRLDPYSSSPPYWSGTSHEASALGQRPPGPMRRPAPLALAPQQTGTNIGDGSAMAFSGLPVGAGPGIGGRLRAGFSSLIPESPSYMALNATCLTVGAWRRMSSPDTELTCLACVELPPPRPVQRPGNHRPAELDSLVGEFQWIIGDCGARYKVVLPNSLISRIRFRELPDTAATLVDLASESVVNPQIAFSLLNQALKNPHAVGELSIYAYAPPTYFFQAGSGEWQEIGDFSEDRSASTTLVHTISGPFAELFRQLRILLATCSRLKMAADPLMALWLGNADDPYTAVAGIPQNTWIPCAGAVSLHSTKRAGGSPAGSDAAAATAGAGAEFAAASAHTPASAAPSSSSTLTPTPTSMSFANAQAPLFAAAPLASRSARGSVFTFHEPTHQPMPCRSTIAAAFVGGAGPGGVCALPFKTQRSASLPFIRPPPGSSVSGPAKTNPSSSLSKTIDGDGDSDGDGACLNTSAADPQAGQAGHGAGMAAAPLSGLGISNTPPPAVSLPLRHRTSHSHLRRPAPYQVAQPTGSPRVNSPQLGTSPFWSAGSAWRPSRDSPLCHHHSHSAFGPVGTGARRESDVELALAMNNAFVNGDVLGAHHGLGELYGMPGVPPSPLSNVAVAADSSAMQIDSMGAQGPPESKAAATTGIGGDVYHSAPAVDVRGADLSKAGPADSVCESTSAIGTSVVMALFHAMAAKAAPSGGAGYDSGLQALAAYGQPQLASVPMPAGPLDLATLAFDPTLPHATDTWVDWAQAVGGGSPQELIPGLLAARTAKAGPGGGAEHHGFGGHLAVGQSGSEPGGPKERLVEHGIGSAL